MVKTLGFVVALCASPLAAWANDYAVYSWNAEAKVAVRSTSSRTFAQARQSAEVLAVLHEMKGAPRMDSEFCLISSAKDRDTTWMVQTDEPFEPIEYVWIGNKDSRIR